MASGLKLTDINTQDLYHTAKEFFSDLTSGIITIQEYIKKDKRDLESCLKQIYTDVATIENPNEDQLNYILNLNKFFENPMGLAFCMGDTFGKYYLKPKKYEPFNNRISIYVESRKQRDGEQFIRRYEFEYFKPEKKTVQKKR